MFCGCKNRKKEAKFVLIQFESVIQNIEKQCDLKEDQEVRRTIGGDFSKLPAFDAKYHPNCYKSYMREHKEQEREKTVHDICFEYLIPEIDAYIQSYRAVMLKVLLERYKEYLQQQEYESFDSYTVQKLRTKIEKHYGNRICFTDEPHKRQSVYNSQISIADAINTAFTYKTLLNDHSLVTDTDRITKKQIILRAAELLRNEIKDVEGFIVHPLNPDDISMSTAEKIVPKSLKEFLQSLCKVRKVADKKTMSIAQDIISLYSGGKKKLPKNLSLGISMKNCLRSKDFIKYLNNLGHCISYDDVLRIETTWTDEIVDAGDGYATIPSKIKTNCYTQAASDNGNYGQECASQHVTNTVLYQYPLEQMNGNFNIDQVHREMSCSKRRRAIKVPHEPFHEYVMQRKPKLPAYYTEMKASDIIHRTTSENFSFSSTLTECWVLLRITGKYT